MGRKERRAARAEARSEVRPRRRRGRWLRRLIVLGGAAGAYVWRNKKVAEHDRPQ